MSLILLSGARGRGPAGNAHVPETANYTVDIVYPRAIGAIPNGLDANNRCYFAYTGLTYEIPLVAGWGSYPHTWSVSNAPAGMTVEPYTTASGETEYKLVWVDPQASATDIVITVTDALGVQDSETFSITVGTAGWVFVDAVNGNDTTGTGVIGAPWQTLSKVYDSSGANSRIYFRTGTYTPAGITTFQNSGGAGSAYELGEERILWDQSSQGATWIAYPGESPLLDFEYTGSGFPYNTGDSKPRIRLIGTAIFVDGIETTRSMTMAFQVSRSDRRGPCFWRNNLHDTGPGIGSGNSAFIMLMQLYGPGGTPDTQGYGDVFASNTFSDIQNGTGNCALKLYSTLKAVISGNAASNTGGSTEVFAIKSDNSQYDFRCNSGTNVDVLAIGGNMHQVQDQTYGEIRFNNIKATGTGTGYGALLVNEDSQAGTTHIYRNTFQSRVTFQHVDANDGPFEFYKNVVVNTDGANSPFPFVEWMISGAADGDWTGTADESRLTVTNNLTGVTADNIVNAAGILQGSYRSTYLGTRGHEIP